MKTSTLFTSLVLAVLVACAAPVFGVDSGVYPYDVDETAVIAAPGAETTELDEVMAEAQPVARYGRTAQAIAALFVLSLLGLIAFWLTRRSGCSRLPTGEYPENIEACGFRPETSDTKILPVP